MSDRLDAAVSTLIPMESFHRNVSAEKTAALRQQALQTLVDEELEYQEGVRLGTKVPAAALQAAWTRMVARYGGARAFDAALRQSGASLVAVRAEIRRTLTIKEIYDRAVTAKCAVSSGEARQFFSANPDRFVEPEQLHIYGITVGVDPSSTPEQWMAAKIRAEHAFGELEAGAPFTDIVSKYSTDPSKSLGGDMGFVHRGSLSEKLEQVAKDLPVGRFSGVIETLYGYHIIRVSEIRPSQKKSFDQVSVNLRKDLTAARCAERKDAWVAGLRAGATVTVAEHGP